jgi:hypothetical protein
MCDVCESLRLCVVARVIISRNVAKPQSSHPRHASRATPRPTPRGQEGVGRRTRRGGKLEQLRICEHSSSVDLYPFALTKKFAILINTV